MLRPPSSSGAHASDQVARTLRSSPTISSRRGPATALSRRADQAVLSGPKIHRSMAKATGTTVAIRLRNCKPATQSPRLLTCITRSV